MSRVVCGGDAEFSSPFASVNLKFNLISRKEWEGNNWYWICCLRLHGSGEWLTVQNSPTCLTFSDGLCNGYDLLRGSFFQVHKFLFFFSC